MGKFIRFRLISYFYLDLEEKIILKIVHKVHQKIEMPEKSEFVADLCRAEDDFLSFNLITFDPVGDFLRNSPFRSFLIIKWFPLFLFMSKEVHVELIKCHSY